MSTPSERRRWVWDLYPLKRKSWGNQEVVDDGTPPGQTVKLRGLGRSYPVSLISDRRPVVGVSLLRDFYIPTEDDLGMLRRRYPKEDPHRPAWHRIKADLIVAGHEAASLDESEAPVLLALLSKAKAARRRRGGRRGKGKAQRKSGSKKKGAVSALQKLKKTTPAFDANSGKWVKNKLAAQLEGVETGTLKRYRTEGIRNTDGTLGQDPHGRVWRRPGLPHSHPWYLRRALKSQRK